MDQSTEHAVTQFTIALRALAESDRQRERLSKLVSSIPPKDYDNFLRETSGILRSGGFPNISAQSLFSSR